MRLDCSSVFFLSNYLRKSRPPFNTYQYAMISQCHILYPIDPHNHLHKITHKPTIATIRWCVECIHQIRKYPVRECNKKNFRRKCRSYVNQYLMKGWLTDNWLTLLDIWINMKSVNDSTISSLNSDTQTFIKYFLKFIINIKLLNY